VVSASGCNPVSSEGSPRYFPEIVAAVDALDVDVVLDGELVLW
jgi:hypothetical protein